MKIHTIIFRTGHTNVQKKCRTNLINTLQKWLTILFFIGVDDPDIDPVEELMYFLDLGEREIQLTKHRNIVLLVGLTGTGKTTLLQFAANDSNRLTSVEKCPGCGEYYLRDEGGYVGNQSLVSQTFLPNFLYNNLMDTALYDCPGFDDNRNTTVSIANAYFIKKITNHAQTVKIVVVATHGSLDASDRSSFPKLLTNLLVLLKDPSKISDSIAIIGTSSTPVHLQPFNFISKYSYFIDTEARRYIDEVYDEPRKTKALQLIDSFLHKNTNGNYTQIGYFRAPSSSGPLEMMEEFIGNKAFVRSLIIDELQYAPTTSDDFGYSPGEDARFVIVGLAGNVSILIREELRNFTTEETRIFVTELQRLFDIGDSDKILLNKLNLLFNVTFPITENGNADFFSNYTNEIITNADLFSMSSISSLNSSLVRYTNYLDILKMVSEFTIDQSNWITPILAMRSEVTLTINPYLSQANIDIKELIEIFSANVQESVQSDIDNLINQNSDAEEFIARLQSISMSTYPICEGPSRQISSCISQILSNTNGFGGQHYASFNATLSRQAEILKDLEMAYDKDTGLLNPAQWVLALINLGNNIMLKIPDIIIAFNQIVKYEVEKFANSTQVALTKQLEMFITDVEQFPDELVFLQSATYPICESDSASSFNMYTGEILNEAQKFALTDFEIINSALSRFGELFESIYRISEFNKAYVTPNLWILPLKGLNITIAQTINTVSSDIARIVTTTSSQTAAEIDTLFRNWFIQFYQTQDLPHPNFENFLGNLTIVTYPTCTNQTLPIQCISEMINGIKAVGLPADSNRISRLQTNHAQFQRIMDVGYEIHIVSRPWVESLLRVYPNIQRFVSDDIVQHIILQGATSIGNVTDSYKKFISEKLRDVQSIGEQETEVYGFERKVFTLVQRAEEKYNESATTAVAFMQTLVTQFEDVFPAITNEMRERIQRSMSLFRVLQKLPQLPWRSEVWFIKIYSLKSAIISETTWVTFLQALYNDLTKYNTQIKSDSGVERKIHGWWRTFGQISLTNFNEFWNYLKNEGVPTMTHGNMDIVRSVLNSSDGTHKIAQINQFLNTIFPPVPTCAHSNGILKCFGDFLSFNEIIRSTSNTSPPHTVVILAFNTLFIDSRFSGSQINVKNNIKIFLMAPKVNLRTNDPFDLAGANSTQNSEHGNNAGSAFYIYDSLEGGAFRFSNLTGGTGASGLNGTNGGPGQKGLTKSFSMGADCHAWSGGYIRITIYPNSCNRNSEETCHAGNSGVNFTIDGGAGGRGANGGPGGNAGAGGFPGQLSTVDVNINNAIAISKGTCGTNGARGIGGSGGLGGYYGDTLRRCVDDVSSGTQKVCQQGGCSSATYPNVPLLIRGPSGERGSDGIVTSNGCTTSYVPWPTAEIKPYYDGYFTQSETIKNNFFMGQQLSTFLAKARSHTGLRNMFN